MLLKNSEWPNFGEAAPADRVGSGIADYLNRLRQRTVAALRNAAVIVAERRKARQDGRTLSRLDDHMLKDMGLSRRDLPGWTEGEIRGWRTLEPWR
jgi:uncharacterized protein YjiS (DUF1127 family)